MPTRSNAPLSKPTPNTRARETARLFAVHRTIHFNAPQRNPTPSIRARGSNSFLCSHSQHSPLCLSTLSAQRKQLVSSSCIPTAATAPTRFTALQRNPILSIRTRETNSSLHQPSPSHSTALPSKRRASSAARAETAGITQPHPPETRARLTNGALSLYCSRKRAAAKGKDAFFFVSPADFGAKTCASFNPAVPARSGTFSNAGRGQFSPSSSASTSSRYFSNTFSTTLSSSTET